MSQYPLSGSFLISTGQQQDEAHAVFRACVCSTCAFCLLLYSVCPGGFVNLNFEALRNLECARKEIYSNKCINQDHGQLLFKPDNLNPVAHLYTS